MFILHCPFRQKYSPELNAHTPLFFLRYLTGNPCTDYEGYREFVVASLPQLEWLDGKEVSRSERILATQRLPELRKEIAEQQEMYARKRVRTNTA